MLKELRLRSLERTPNDAGETTARHSVVSPRGDNNAEGPVTARGSRCNTARGELHDQLNVSAQKSLRNETHKDVLLSRIAFGPEDGFIYKNHPLKPACHFFPFLTRSGRNSLQMGLVADGDDSLEKNITIPMQVKVRIPPTMVIGGMRDTSELVVFYSDDSGHLFRCENASSKLFRQLIALGKIDDADVLGGASAISRSVTDAIKPSPEGKKASKKSLGASASPGFANPDDISSGETPLTILKRTKCGFTSSNDIQLLNPKQTLMNILNPSFPTVTVLQKFVRSKGPSSVLTRFVWEVGKGSFAFQISNRCRYEDVHEKDPTRRFTTSLENVSSLDIFPLKGKALLGDIESMASEMMRFVVNHVKPRPIFTFFVADFIKDTEGVWWYIQTKAFRLAEECLLSQSISLAAQVSRTKASAGGIDVAQKERSRILRLHPCAICGIAYRSADLGYMLTLKMIHATEKHLKRHGKILPWFDRPEFKSPETAAWYQPRHVCKACYELYVQEKKLEKAELLFAKMIGIPVDVKNCDVASVVDTYNKRCDQLKTKAQLAFDDGETGRSRVTLPSKMSPSRMSPNQSMIPNTSRSLLVSSRSLGGQFGGPLPHAMTLFRILIFLHEIHNLPDVAGPLYLKMSFLYNTLKVPIRTIDASSRSAGVTPVNRLRVFHFFTEVENSANVSGLSPRTMSPATGAGSPFAQRPMRPRMPRGPSSDLLSDIHSAVEDKKPEPTYLKQFIRKEKELVVELWQPGHGTLGCSRLPLLQFEGGLVEKLEFVKFFSTKGKELCSLRATVGLIKGRNLPTADLTLREHESGVFVPSDDFFSVDPLPDEWMHLVLGSNQADISFSTPTTSPVKSPTKSHRSSEPLGRSTEQLKKGPKSRFRSSYSYLRTRLTAGNRAMAPSIRNFEDKTEVRVLDIDEKARRRKRLFSNPAIMGQNAPEAKPIEKEYGSVQNIRITVGRKTSKTSRNLESLLSIASDGAGLMGGAGGESEPLILSDADGELHSDPMTPTDMPARLSHTPDQMLSWQQGSMLLVNDAHGLDVATLPTSLSNYLKSVAANKREITLWQMAVHTQTVSKLDSEIDESWIIQYSVFGQIVQHEAFQIFLQGPLVFDAERSFYIFCADPYTLFKHFKDIARIQVTLTQKFNVMIVRDAEIAFASLLPEALRNATKEPFPNVEVEGMYPLTTRCLLSMAADRENKAEHDSFHGSVLSSRDLAEVETSSAGRRARNRQSNRKVKTPVAEDDDLVRAGTSRSIFRDGSLSGSLRKGDLARGDSDGTASWCGAEFTSDADSNSEEGEEAMEDEEDEDARKPQLVATLRLSKVTILDGSRVVPVSWLKTPHGPLVVIDVKSENATL